MSKILLVDTNFSALPIYNSLISNDNEVFVVGSNPNDFLAKTVKNYIKMDYSDIDEMRLLIDSSKFDFILPGGNDLSYKVCAALNNHGRFSGIDNSKSTEIINNKEKFREFATRISLPVPQVIPVEFAEDFWPVIVKPADAYSGHGVTIVREFEKDKFHSAVENATKYSTTKTCLVEEYIEGQLYSHSCFISDGFVLIDFIVEEHCTANKFVVDTSRLDNDFPQDMLLKIREAICLMAKELNMADGLIHTQFIKRGDKFWLIEVTRRCPGDLYSMLIEYTTGFRYAEAYSKTFLNSKLILNSEPSKHTNILRHTISQPGEGYLASLKFKIPVNIVELVPLSLAGDYIKPSPYSRIALLFLSTNSKEDLDNIFEITLKRELYQII
jgi:carbamoylphosphate synthase large subunit